MPFDRAYCCSRVVDGCSYTSRHGRRKHFYSGEAIGGIKTIIVLCASSRGVWGRAARKNFGILGTLRSNLVQFLGLILISVAVMHLSMTCPTYPLLGGKGGDLTSQYIKFPNTYRVFLIKSPTILDSQVW